MSHFWPKSEPPILNRHHFGVRIFTFGWGSSFLGISVMQTTRLMQDFPDPNLLQENCARPQEKKKRNRIQKRQIQRWNHASSSSPSRACWHEIIPDSLEKQAPLATLCSKKHMLPALRFSSRSLKAQLAS